MLLANQHSNKLNFLFQFFFLKSHTKHNHHLQEFQNNCVCNKFSFFSNINKLYNRSSYMNIGIIGSGGREHALCKKVSESKIVKNFLFSWKC